MVTPTKQGIKTTEFWLTTASVLIMLIDNALNLNLPKDSLYAVIAYILTRGWIKGKAAGTV
jgi:hypothetical protein